MVDDKTGGVTIRLEDFAPFETIPLEWEGERAFVTLRLDNDGRPLASPERIELDVQLLRKLPNGPEGFPEYRYLGVVKLRR